MHNHQDVLELMKEWTEEVVDSSNSEVAPKYQKEFIENFIGDLEEYLTPGQKLGYALESSLDSASPYLWPWLDSCDAGEIADILNDPHSEDIHGEYYTDVSGFEAVRRASVDFLCSWIVNEMREKWEEKFGVDPLNEDIFLT